MTTPPAPPLSPPGRSLKGAQLSFQEEKRQGRRRRVWLGLMRGQARRESESERESLEDIKQEKVGDQSG